MKSAYLSLASVMIVLLIFTGCSLFSSAENLPDPPSPDVNILKNPEFQSEVGQLPEGWSKGKHGQLGDHFRFEDGLGREGGRAFRLHDDSSTNSFQLDSSPFEVFTGVTYRVSIWMKAESGWGRATLYFRNENNEILVSDSVRTQTEHGTNWVQLSLELEAPANAASATISLGTSSSNVGVIYFEDPEVVVVL